MDGNGWGVEGTYRVNYKDRRSSFVWHALTFSMHISVRCRLHREGVQRQARGYDENRKPTNKTQCFRPRHVFWIHATGTRCGVRNGSALTNGHELGITRPSDAAFDIPSANIA